MKKILNYLLILLVMIFPFAIVSAKTTTTTEETTVNKNGEKVNLYVFYGSTCSHCADLHTYLAELEEDEDYNYMFEVVDYEVWSDDDNATLMTNVAEKLGTEASGVPLYVVGDYYSEGFPDIDSTDEDVQAVVKETEDELKAAIKKAYEAANATNPTYEDIVAEVGSGNATVSDDDKDEDSNANDIIGYIILGITVIVIIAIIFGRSSSKEDDLIAEEVANEEVEETPVEEVSEEVEEPKKEVKKTTSKKTSSAKKTSTTKKTSSTKSTSTRKAATKKTSTAKKTTSSKTK